MSSNSPPLDQNNISQSGPQIFFKRPKEIQGSVTSFHQGLIQYTDNETILYDKYNRVKERPPRQEKLNNNFICSILRDNKSTFILTHDGSNIKLQDTQLKLIADANFEGKIETVLINPSSPEYSIIFLSNGSLYTFSRGAIEKFPTDKNNMKDICMFSNNLMLYRIENNLYIHNLGQNIQEYKEITPISGNQTILKVFSFNLTMFCVIYQKGKQNSILYLQFFELSENQKYENSYIINISIGELPIADLRIVSLINSPLFILYFRNTNYMKAFQCPSIKFFNEVRIVSDSNITDIDSISFTEDRIFIRKRKENDFVTVIYNIGHNEYTIPTPYPLPSRHKSIFPELPGIIKGGFENIPAVEIQPELLSQLTSPQPIPERTPTQNIPEKAPAQNIPEKAPAQNIPEKVPAQNIPEKVPAQNIPEKVPAQNVQQPVVQNVVQQPPGITVDMLLSDGKFFEKILLRLEEFLTKNRVATLDEVKKMIPQICEDIKREIIEQINGHVNIIDKSHKQEEKTKEEQNKIIVNNDFGNAELLGCSYLFIPDDYLEGHEEDYHVSMSQFSNLISATFGDKAITIEMEFRSTFEEDLLFDDDPNCNKDKINNSIIRQRTIEGLKGTFVVPTRKMTYIAYVTDEKIYFYDDSNDRLMFEEDISESEVYQILSLPDSNDIWIFRDNKLYKRLVKESFLVYDQEISDFALNSSGEPIFITTDNIIYNDKQKAIAELPEGSELWHFSVIAGKTVFAVYMLDSSLYIMARTESDVKELKVYEEFNGDVYVATSLYSNYVCLWTSSQEEEGEVKYQYKYYKISESNITEIIFDGDIKPSAENDDCKEMYVSNITFINPGVIPIDKNALRDNFSKEIPLLYLVGDFEYDTIESIKKESGHNVMLNDHQLLRTKAWVPEHFKFEIPTKSCLTRVIAEMERLEKLALPRPVKTHKTPMKKQTKKRLL